MLQKRSTFSATSATFTIAPTSHKKLTLICLSYIRFLPLDLAIAQKKGTCGGFPAKQKTEELLARFVSAWSGNGTFFQGLEGGAGCGGLGEARPTRKSCSSCRSRQKNMLLPCPCCHPARPRPMRHQAYIPIRCPNKHKDLSC